MTLSKEDIQKYGTEEEKKILKEARPVKDALKIAFPEIGDENTMECPGCKGEKYISGEPCDICFGTGVVATDYKTKEYYNRIHKHFSGGYTFPANENPTKDNMRKEPTEEDIQKYGTDEEKKLLEDFEIPKGQTIYGSSTMFDRSDVVNISSKLDFHIIDTFDFVLQLLEDVNAYSMKGFSVMGEVEKIFEKYIKKCRKEK